MKSVGGDRAGHVMVVAHVHVHKHKLAEFLVKAATLLPHCRAEKGNVFENVYRSTACAGNGSDDPCVRTAPPVLCLGGREGGREGGSRTVSSISLSRPPPTTLCLALFWPRALSRA